MQFVEGQVARTPMMKEVDKHCAGIVDRFAWQTLVKL
jgi:hypothetical protein